MEDKGRKIVTVVIAIFAVYMLVGVAGLLPSQIDVVKIMGVEYEEINDYEMSGSNTRPFNVYVDPSDGVWVGDNNGIVHKFSNGQFTPYLIDASADISDMVMDDSGYLWCMALAGKIWRLNPSTGAVTGFPLSTTNSISYCLDLDSDGNLWFASFNKNYLGKMNTVSGVVTEYAIAPSLGDSPIDLVVDQNDDVWIAMLHNNVVGRRESGSWEKIPLGADVYPHGIALDSNNNLWLTVAGASTTDFISKINDARDFITWYAIPENPQGIAIYGETIWYCQPNSGSIASFTIDGEDIVTTQYELNDATYYTSAIAVDSDGVVYFTQNKGDVGSGKIGVLGGVQQQVIPPEEDGDNETAPVTFPISTSQLIYGLSFAFLIVLGMAVNYDSISNRWRRK